MNIQGMHLAWVVVKKLDDAIKFYTDVVGLQLKKVSKENGWAELSGPTGAILGITEQNNWDGKKPGANAVVTITVTNLQKARDALMKKGAALAGEIMEVPGHVKLQTFHDRDGNTLQLVQTLEKK